MPDFSIKVGEFVASEADDLGLVFYGAVHEGTAEFYSFEQRQAWMPKIPSGPNWASRLASQMTVVARKNDLPVGFMTLDDSGYIDLAFVAPLHQRQGIGGLLYERIERLARKKKMERLHSQASCLIRGLFEQRGWEIVCEQQIERAGVTLTNFLMEKRLHDKAQRTGTATD
ncbi:MAG: GNAT family N-acetyltransferase [Pseudomonadota bacterium]